MVTMAMTKIPPPDLQSTKALALALHGPDYFGHLERADRYFVDFVSQLPAGLLTEEEFHAGRLVVYLHDSIEDGFTTRSALEALGYPESVLDRVEGLTRDPARELYQKKIETIADSGDAVLIVAKLADNKDNSTKDRIVSLPIEKQSLVRLYRGARTTLHAGLAKILIDRGMGEDDVAAILSTMAAFDTGDY
jgi:hypothetical protein